MYVLLVTHYYEPEVGAPQRRWAALVQRLIANGHHVTVVCPPPHYPDRFSTHRLRQGKHGIGSSETGSYGETIYRMPYLLHGYSGKIRALDQLITALASIVFISSRYQLSKRGHCRPQLVISTVPGLPSIFVGIAISKILNIPHIAEMRDAWPDVVTGDLLSQTTALPWHKKFVKNLMHRTVTKAQKSADAIVTTTEWFASILRSRGMEKVYVVPNGAEERMFSAAEPIIPAQIPTGNLRVQYVGTVGRSQGLDTLVSALAHIKMQRPDLTISTRISWWRS